MGNRDRPGRTVTTVCLVRHGETDWNAAGRLQGREDTSLNPRGRRQAHLSGQALRNTAWDVALTSPLRRAAETAEIITALAGIPRTVVVPALAERDYGAASGLTRAEALAAFPDGVPGEEDRAAVRDRALTALLSWVDRYPGGRLLVVSHGGVIGALLAAATGDDVATATVRLHNACLSVLHHTDGRWRVLAHNVVEHLRELDG